MKTELNELSFRHQIGNPCLMCPITQELERFSVVTHSGRGGVIEGVFQSMFH